MQPPPPAAAPAPRASPRPALKARDVSRDLAGSTGRLGAESAGEALAALAATGGEDRAARAGAHAEAEAMGAAATPVARLESALAHLGLLPLIRRVRRLPG